MTKELGSDTSRQPSSAAALQQRSMNPVRDAIVSFFESLLCAPETVHERSNSDNPLEEWLTTVKAKTKSFHEVSEQHYDRVATRSDAVYARFISMLNIISVSQLLKLCEGFRRIPVNNAYESLNNARVAANEGIRTLAYGSRNGIMPVALSYRHSPHSLTTTIKTVALATVDMETADRFKNLVRDSHDGEVVVWIDRAVKGLSVDGEWFVRGLLPYSLVPVVAAHRGPADWSRPWIYLEWRLSTRAFSTKGLVSISDPSDALVIVLQAMFAPGNMLRNYEYAEEMEEVILDMVLFGLCAIGGKPTEGHLREEDVLRWDDLKVTSAVALALSSFEFAGNKEAQFGTMAIDKRDPYDTGIFRCGLMAMLDTVGIRLSTDGVFEAFKMIDGKFVITKRDGDRHFVLMRVPGAALRSLAWNYGKISVADMLREEVESTAHRYDLRTTKRNVTFDSADELAVLSCCDVWSVKGVIQRRSCDDADATLPDGMAQRCGVRDSESTVECRFNARKARENVERRGRHSLAAWRRRVRKGETSEDIRELGLAGKAVIEDEVDATPGALWISTQFGSVRFALSLETKAVSRRFQVTATKQRDAPAEWRFCRMKSFVRLYVKELYDIFGSG
eukprot:GFKZ01002475.1.p1 GENE.GFKZ01002475.1~~GFKZ01002475.1.p1  ORF type:complete len:619 (-),score=64.16 GFKZ01002475.1:551-2407(-)